MSVLIIGMGLMGRGIAATLLVQTNMNVIVVDTSGDILKVAHQYIHKLAAKKGLKSSDVDSRLHQFSKLKDAFEDDSEIEYVIEAVPENFELKAKIFKEVEQLAKPNTILATNTSSIPITRIAESIKCRSQVVGMHFFNPVPVMRGIEVIPTKYTDSTVVEKTKKLGESMGKTVSVCSLDIAGFLVNRILNANFLEAVRLVEIGAGTPEEIDNIMESAANLPMGPLRLTDFVGVDTATAIAHIIYEDSGRDPRYKPSTILDDMVKEGKLGAKSGEGFYKYQSKL